MFTPDFIVMSPCLFHCNGEHHYRERKRTISGCDAIINRVGQPEKKENTHHYGDNKWEKDARFIK